MAKSRFLTHTVVLLVAALIPILPAFSRIQQVDNAYGAGFSSPAAAAPSSNAADLVTIERGFIRKPSTATPDPPARRPVTTYTVKTGDTLEDIAAQYGLTPNTLRWSNGLTDDSAVLPGRALLIPPANGVLVKVEATTDLAALATQYHVAIQDIIDYNYVRDPQHLTAGSFLMVPDGQGPPIARRAGNPRTVTFSHETVVYYGAVYGSANHFPWGYCTWWVANKRPIPWGGNAWEWWWQARQFRFAEGQVPKVGAIMVQGITAWSPVGHVAYVESVNRDGSFTVSEMNYGRWGVVDFRTITSMQDLDLLGFIY